MSYANYKVEVAYTEWRRVTGGHPEAAALLTVAQILLEALEVVDVETENPPPPSTVPVSLSVNVNGEPVEVEKANSPSRPFEDIRKQYAELQSK